jgi:2-hydroxy-3-keto-5-methylthiopentenyl-1-phosphate phosphatase
LTATSGPEVLKLLNNLDKESKALIEDIATLAIYSGQSYEQVWHLTHEEKRIFLKVLKEKISIDKGIKPTQTLTQEKF